MQQQAQPPFCGQHPRAFWERSLLYTKCQPHGAVPPPVMPLSSSGTLAEGRGLCLALARWCLKEKPSCEGTLSPSLPSQPGIWWAVGGEWGPGLGTGASVSFSVHQTPQPAADAMFTPLPRTPTHRLPPGLRWLACGCKVDPAAAAPPASPPGTCGLPFVSLHGASEAVLSRCLSAAWCRGGGPPHLPRSTPEP